MFISASGFVVTADGNVTASNIDLSGGLAATFGFFSDRMSVGGTQDVPNVIISASGEISSSGFFVDSLGNVTASNMKLQGGLASEEVVSNFGFFGDRLEVGGVRGTPNVLISGSGFISSSKFQIDTEGFITASGGKLGAWTIDDAGIEKAGVFEIKPDETYVISSSNFSVDSAGNVTASSIDLSGELAAEGVTATFGFFGDRLSVGGTQAVPNVIISASGEISSSGFFVDSLGNVTASNMKLQDTLESEAVVSNFGFFGDSLEVGGSRGNPNVLILSLIHI